MQSDTNGQDKARLDLARTHRDQQVTQQISEDVEAFELAVETLGERLAPTEDC